MDILGTILISVIRKCVCERESLLQPLLLLLQPTVSMVTLEPILVSMVTSGWHPQRKREKEREMRGGKRGGEDVEVEREGKKGGGQQKVKEKELEVGETEKERV